MCVFTFLKIGQRYLMSRSDCPVSVQTAQTTSATHQCCQSTQPHSASPCGNAQAEALPLFTAASAQPL